jgi:hypothetical protein
MTEAMASDKQVQYCRSLFRKTKMYYRCLESDADLRDEVLKRTGFDLDDLLADQAQAIIGKLKLEASRQRRF